MMKVSKNNIIELRRTTDAFNYWWEGEIPADTIVKAKMPVVTANKRGINEIGWQCDGSASLYATLSNDHENTTLWSVIQPNHLINKTVSWLKIDNSGNPACTLCLRVILN